MLSYLISCFALVATAFATEPNMKLGEDVISCLASTNLTADEVMNITFFNPNVTLSHNAKCFGACLIATDYNVTVTPEGIVEKEELLISAIMEDSEMNLANATDVLDTCKSIISPKMDGCDNIYNYATCVNQIYFEKMGFRSYSGNIVEDYDPNYSFNETYEATSTTSRTTKTT